MKEIYIVISQTGTILSRILKMVTKKEYNHASIAMEKNLSKMYSFGRKNPYNPFLGAFVIEGIYIGTFKRFKNTTCKVIRLDVTDGQYAKAAEEIKRISENRQEYKYNILGLFLAGVNKARSVNNKFYCSEFVKHILETAEIDISELPETVHPINFLMLKNTNIEYEGRLREYKRF